MIKFMAKKIGTLSQSEYHPLSCRIYRTELSIANYKQVNQTCKLVNSACLVCKIYKVHIL